jgi:hypothetical protein
MRVSRLCSLDFNYFPVIIGFEAMQANITLVGVALPIFLEKLFDFPASI